MRRVVLLSVVLFGVSAFVGAGSRAVEPDPKLHQPPDPVLPVTAEAVGIVVEKAQGGYKFVDLTKDVVFGQRLQINVPVNTTIFTRHPVKLRIHVGDEVKDVLFGPNPGGDDYAAMKIVNSQTSIYLVSGYVLLVSDQPTVKTDRVEAAADGCEWIVQVDTDKNLHRVYFWSGANGYATITGEQTTRSTNQPQSVIEVKDDFTSPDGWKPLEGDLLNFAQDVVDKAAAGHIYP